MSLVNDKENLHNGVNNVHIKVSKQFYFVRSRYCNISIKFLLFVVPS